MSSSVWQRDRHRALRQRAVDAMGGRCVRCGFDDYRALQFDHIHGGGIRELGGNGYKGSAPEPSKRMKAIIAGERPDLQLLCANCNWIKKSENNEVRGVAALTIGLQREIKS